MRIFHLEDEAPLAEIIKMALVSFDAAIEVVQYPDSDEALKYIEKDGAGIDLFLLDVRVKGSLNGLQLAEKIRDLKLDAPMLVTSAYEPPRNLDLIKLDYRWIRKPWRLQELTEKMLMMARAYHRRRTPAESAPAPAAPASAPAVPATPAAPPVDAPTPPTGTPIAPPAAPPVGAESLPPADAAPTPPKQDTAG